MYSSSRLPFILLIISIFFCNVLAARDKPTKSSSSTSLSFNVIDRCWRANLNWSTNRQRLGTCSVGFAGKMTNNIGNNVKGYQVTDPSDDPNDPKPGTLRYGANRLGGKVWITFSRDMTIKLKKVLVIGSFTTIDGRGADVHIAYGACFFIDQASNVIIHGLRIHHCRPQSQTTTIGSKTIDTLSSDGDAISIVNSTKIWIDHNTLYKCYDGLIDVTLGSTNVTISNNWFRDHDKVMLLGHADEYKADKNMKVTVVLNHFGPNCNQRMPRVRWGYAHVVNNLYQGWRGYAIGGSMNPRVKSEGNYFVASDYDDSKEVTSRMNAQNGTTDEILKKKGFLWNFKSLRDFFENGALFSQVGQKDSLMPNYDTEQDFVVADAQSVKSLTRSAGALRCYAGIKC